ncbi:MAG: DUF883 family protein [Casimicrobiaceae bacterium]
MVTSRSTRARRSAGNDFGDVLGDAESVLRQSAAESGERAKDLRAKLEATLAAAKSMLADLQDDAVDRAKLAARVTDEYVHDNPWQAIGAAAAVGLIVGVLVSRR